MASHRTTPLYFLPLLLIPLSLFLPLSSAQGELEVPTVSIEPFRLSLATGEFRHVTCSASGLGAGNVTSIVWLDGSETDIRDVNSSRVAYDDVTPGIMVLRDAQLSDAGTYTCVVTVNQTAGAAVDSASMDAVTYNATFVYNVYVMPSYFTEGMIILGVNLFLAAVFGACLIRSMVADKSRLVKYGKVASSE
jgi:hypothetical protein